MISNISVYKLQPLGAKSFEREPCINVLILHSERATGASVIGFKTKRRFFGRPKTIFEAVKVL